MDFSEDNFMMGIRVTMLPFGIFFATNEIFSSKFLCFFKGEKKLV